MKTPNLNKHARLFKKAKALLEVCKDLHKPILRELKKCEKGQAISGGVEYHLTNKTKKEYSAELKKKIEDMRKAAEEAGTVKITENESFDAQIPKSVTEQVYASASTEYRKHFGVK